MKELLEKCQLVSAMAHAFRAGLDFRISVYRNRSKIIKNRPMLILIGTKLHQPESASKTFSAAQIFHFKPGFHKYEGDSQCFSCLNVKG